jgi:hypothetical protein
MRTQFRFVLIAGAATLFLASSAAAQFPQIRTARQELRDAAAFRRQLPPDTPWRAADGATIVGVRCATHGLTEQEHAAASARSTGFAAQVVDALTGGAFDVGSVSGSRAKSNRVRLRVHVLHDGDEGNVLQKQIRNQVKVLNKAFRKWGFQFKLKGVTRTDNANWFNDCARNSVSKRFTRALSVNAAKNLNVYLCNPSQGFLGWAILAGSRVANTKQDGIFINYATLPGGTAVPYDLGDTVTHEVGHYLGLLHTFQGGCGGSGDFVDDTPAQQSPTFGCAVGSDSCASEGLDPIENFMGYSDDLCMTGFTPGQAERMVDQVGLHRGQL